MHLLDDARALTDDLVRLRRHLHGIPEVGLQLPRTQEAVLLALDGLPLEVTTGTSTTSVTAVLRGARPGPAVLLRGDMDALPVTERTGLPFAAPADRMHACGHDLHTAMLAGAARLLAAHRDRLAGDVILMFQPGEEGFDGAAHMLAEGVLDAAGPRPVAAYALHVSAHTWPSGLFTARGGPELASCATLEVTVRGAGGHGSAPHRALDPIPAACEMVTALQTWVTRSFDVFDPVVLTVGSFHAGTQTNVIPDTAAFQATVRSFSEEARERLRSGTVAVCRGIAAAHGLEVDAAFHDLYPVTVNDHDETAFAAETVREVHGRDRFAEMENPLLGAEDFSRVIAEVPGAMVFLGATPPGADPATAPANHSPLAAFDEAVLPDGAALYAELAVRRLAAAARAAATTAEAAASTGTGGAATTGLAAGGASG
ncbi:M20 family metallopeptidase [Streptomyces sp. DSM 44917]|uniref:M20 family metallopeptidase n=1 Tax=Streptomyces boetiae TaxID=3075541 RepID=A0ABU2LCN0_9ACTN|nr:M20 family metallopeptidase [Streptomyces sp. DSM 44917]MDT0309335.1 M20 family metallopeptidase [Streptomyces sp. DSM 44917]